MERFQILDLELGKLSEVLLCDQSYAISEMVEMMQQAGFGSVQIFPHWDGKAIYDAQEWIVYVATVSYAETGYDCNLYSTRLLDSFSVLFINQRIFNIWRRL